MTATTTLPPATDPVYAPGDLVDLGEHCPERCVTWDGHGTCWGLTRTRRRARRPETAVYKVLAPVDDPEAFMAGRETAAPPTPALAPVGAGTPPPEPPPSPPAVDPASPDPVERVRAVFGADVVAVADPAELKRLAGKLVANQRQRDPAVLDGPEWARLVIAVEGELEELVAAARGVVGWCEAEDPERLGLGGWKRLVAQVESFEGRQPVPQARLVPWVCECPPEARQAGKSCSRNYHTAS